MIWGSNYMIVGGRGMLYVEWQADISSSYRLVTSGQRPVWMAGGGVRSSHSARDNDNECGYAGTPERADIRVNGLGIRASKYFSVYLFLRGRYIRLVSF
jgi:hypothetical protein